jgi:biotin operon repressor
MALGRPHSKDYPEKYKNSFELHRLTQATSPSGTTLADEVAAYLEWAISSKQEGFEKGEIISIGALAAGLGKSRNTAAKSVEQLVAKGMLARTKLKSPYEIVSHIPIFKDSSLVADEQISLTLKMDSESTFSDVRRLTFPNPEDPFATLLVEELNASSDGLIQEARTRNWIRGDVLYYLRLRSTRKAASQAGYLAEVTFLNLDSDQSAGFIERFTRLREQKVSRFSMYSVLEQCGLSDLRAGRTQVSVGHPPGFVSRELEGFINGRTIDIADFAAGTTMLKWSYALFKPDADPMATFSVCYVRPELISIFIRKLDVELK